METANSGLFYRLVQLSLPVMIFTKDKKKETALKGNFR
jgi:hypothetical protein